ncbi:hypothetical protein VPH35_096639 [Triticum aestivum]
MCDQVLRGKPWNKYIQRTRQRDVSSRFPLCFPSCVRRFNGGSVYSVGCALGGKLGHGTRTDEKYPRLIEQFRTLNIQPIVVAASAWYAVVVGKDGRVCTWGWGRYGCLGHGNEECEYVPKVVEALSSVKAVYVATGDYSTFIVSRKGDVYSFGCGESSSLGHNTTIESNVLSPDQVTSLQSMNEKVSGKFYAFGAGDKGQLGSELVAQESERGTPERVEIDLS